MSKKPFPLSRVHRLLGSGPVVMVTTAGAGRPNVMSMAWHTMMDFDPPLIGCVIDRRSLTFGTLTVTKECVINIPTVELAAKVMGCGRTSGRRIDKFKIFGLTPLPAAKVAPPLIRECYANVECTVVDTRLEARMAAKYNFFILKAVKAWIDRGTKKPVTLHHLGGRTFMAAGKTVTLPSP
jgi:flavin reductase (DIM6/NTAB) family NADH-FMN oxidoreductase RutF